MRLFVCMLNPLVQENITLYCPLWWKPLLYSLSLLFFIITSSYNARFSLTLNDLAFLEAIFIALFAPMTTYLKDLTKSIGRYGGLSWQKMGLRIFGSTSSISTWCKEFWLAWGGNASSTCLNDPWQYTLTEMWENITHYVAFLVQHQLFSMSYLMSAHNYKRCLR